STQTSIDWICSNLPHEKITTKVIHAGISDHSAQTCHLVNEKPTEPSTYKRSFSQTNLEELKSALQQEDWSNVLLATSPLTRHAHEKKPELREEKLRQLKTKPTH
ncbi:hypothetical protein J6590_107028, partial [Homalodisca vitripennis]